MSQQHKTRVSLVIGLDQTSHDPSWTDIINQQGSNWDAYSVSISIYIAHYIDIIHGVCVDLCPSKKI